MSGLSCVSMTSARFCRLLTRFVVTNQVSPQCRHLQAQAGADVAPGKVKGIYIAIVTVYKSLYCVK